MNLNNFLKNKKKDTTNILIDKESVKISYKENEINFYFDNLEEVINYEKFLFFAPSEKKIVSSIGGIENFFEKSVEVNVEGIMLKSLKELYKPGLRVGAMYKYKREPKELDVVILSGIYGKGKRGGLASSFIVGVREPLTDTFLAIGKVSSGFKENINGELSLTKLNELLNKYKIKESREEIIYEPKVVMEIKYQEILKSPKYESGYALRFPRVVRLRDDKDVSEIATVEEIKNYINEN